MRRKEISPVELTRLYLDRCEMYGEKLTCVVTLTDQLAMHQAKRAEEEITAGNYRGPLHGIPWGAKDLLAAKGYPTTWGATPFRNQTTATMIQLHLRRRIATPDEFTVAANLPGGFRVAHIVVNDLQHVLV